MTTTAATPMNDDILRVKLPGIGGSLGECVICGDTFVTEILLGRSVSLVQLPHLFGDKDLPVHKKCVDAWQKRESKMWQDLPEGPLRRCCAAAELKRDGEQSQ